MEFKKLLLTGCAITSLSLISCNRSERAPDSQADVDMSPALNSENLNDPNDPAVSGVSDAQGRAATPEKKEDTRPDPYVRSDAKEPPSDAAR